MQTTLNEIKKYNPCNDSWAKGLKYLNKTKADDEPIDFMTIHKVMGIKDTIWCLRTQDYKDYCLFLADVAESVLPIFEAEYPDDKRPRQAIKAIRDWHCGDIDTKELRILADAAFDAKDAAAAEAIYSASITTAYVADATAYAAYAAYAAGSYAAANTAACTTTSYATYAAYAATANTAAYTTTSYAAYDYDIMKENWEKIEELFIKHFGKK